MRISEFHLQWVGKAETPLWAPLLDGALLAKPSILKPSELRYLRLRAGWTALEVAQALGVSSNVTVSRWEAGARRIPKPTERLFRLLMANALGRPSLRSLMDQFKCSWRHTTGSLEIDLYPEKDHFEYRWAGPPRKVPRTMHRLFWDTDPQGLDLQRYADYIIGRVLEKGDLAEWNWLRWTYGEARLARALRQNRKLSPATARLWAGELAHCEAD